MALFNLTDITFQAPGQPKGPLSALQSSQYELNTYRYPEDIGSSDKGHYIAININEQTKTSYGGTLDRSTLPSVIQNRVDNNIATFGGNLGKTINGAGDLVNNIAGTLGAGSNFTGQITGAFDTLQSKISQFGQVGTGVNASIDTIKSFVTNASSVAFTRTVRRITDTVVLYMPDNLKFSYKQQYNTSKLGGTIGAAGLAAGASIADGVKSNDPNASANLGQNLSYMFMNLNRGVADSILGQGAGNAIFAAGAGMVQNPMMEMIYSNPEFRTFTFDFVFYPRSEGEASQVQKIIDRLRFHQAPELVTASGGFFLVPPSEFDISFYYNGKENPNIPKISTCVLKSIDTDYAPGGFATYEVPGQNAQKGGTGMPVAIKMSLTFEETEMIYKNSNLLDGNKKSGSMGSIVDKVVSNAGEYAVNSKGEGLY
jgi:hypothetical protein